MDTFTTKTEEVLKALEEAGDTGVLSSELIPITHRFGAAFHNLRKRGHCIDVVHVGNYNYLNILVKCDE